MMYCTEETPKKCPKCGCTESKVRQSYTVHKPKKVTRRKRICSNCPEEFETNTPIDRRFL